MIKIINLHKSFGGNKVLQGINLEIRKGENMVIIGQSGSGKSVLIKHLIGLMKPDRGEIYVDGVEITRLKRSKLYKIRKKFGMLFQSAALFDSMTVAENVKFGLDRYTNLTESEKKKRVSQALEMVGLKNTGDLMPHELSGGMKKRVGLARAISYNPEIMLYDEPSTGIDPIRADAINDLIVNLKKEMGVTSIVITHDMTGTFKVADRISMLYKGVIIETGTPEEIKKNSNPIVQQFIKGIAEGPIQEY